jgi:hypothetical protein
MIVFKRRRVKEKQPKRRLNQQEVAFCASLNRRNTLYWGVSPYTFSALCAIQTVVAHQPHSTNTLLAAGMQRVHLPGWKSVFVLSLIRSQELTTFPLENTFAPCSSRGNCCERALGRGGEKRDIPFRIKRNQYSIHSAPFIVRATLSLFVLLLSSLCAASYYDIFHISWRDMRDG